MNYIELLANRAMGSSSCDGGVERLAVLLGGDTCGVSIGEDVEAVSGRFAGAAVVGDTGVPAV